MRPTARVIMACACACKWNRTPLPSRPAVNCLLVTMDVKSLYARIRNSEGISAVKAAYENYPEEFVATKVIITILALILALINSMSIRKNYLQIESCAMGTACPQVMQTSLGPDLNGNIFTHLLKTK